MNTFCLKLIEKRPPGVQINVEDVKIKKIPALFRTFQKNGYMNDQDIERIKSASVTVLSDGQIKSLEEILVRLKIGTPMETMKVAFVSNCGRTIGN